MITNLVSKCVFEYQNVLQTTSSACVNQQNLKKQKNWLNFFLLLDLIHDQRVLSRDVSLSLKGNKNFPFSLHI